MFSGKGQSGGREASWEVSGAGAGASGGAGGAGGPPHPQVFLLPVPVGENIEDQELEIQLWEQGSMLNAAGIANANLSLSSGR